jgi:hypothetical protein
MKNIFNKTIALLVVILTLGACEKNAILEMTEPVASGAKMKFFFHVDGAPRTNFFLDSKKVTGVLTNNDGDVLGNLYRSVYPSNAYAIVPAGSFSLSAVGLEQGELASVNLTLEEDKHYSAYLAGTTDNYEVFVIEDNLPLADHTTIHWRFVNTMANMPAAVDVYAVRAEIPPSEENPEGEDEEIISLGTNIGFKEHGDYVKLKTGLHTYKVFLSGTDYDPSTTTPYIQHKVTLGSLGRVYSTQIRGEYSESPASNQIDFWRER